jgi:large subunit ribosomal protein L17
MSWLKEICFPKNNNSEENMKHKISQNKLSRGSSQRKALLRNLVTDTIKHGKITTTKARAKEARPLVEKMITIAKNKDFNSIRKVSEFILDKKVIDHLFDNVSVKFNERNGGYSRIVSLGTRQGDNAEIAILELID